MDVIDFTTKLVASAGLPGYSLAELWKALAENKDKFPVVDFYVKKFVYERLLSRKDDFQVFQKTDGPEKATMSKEGLKYANRVQLKGVPSYADVEKKAKTTFIVASYALRTKFLGCVAYNFVALRYCILEAIGRSGPSGALQAELPNRLHSSVQPKTIFSHLKQLEQANLITRIRLSNLVNYAYLWRYRYRDIPQLVPAQVPPIGMVFKKNDTTHRSMYLQALRVEAQADGVLIPLVVNALKAAPKNLLPLFTIRSLLNQSSKGSKNAARQSVERALVQAVAEGKVQLCRIRRPNTLVFHEFLRLPSDSPANKPADKENSNSAQGSSSSSSSSKQKTSDGNSSQASSSSSPRVKPGKREVSDAGDVEVEGIVAGELLDTSVLADLGKELAQLDDLPDLPPLGELGNENAEMNDDGGGGGGGGGDTNGDDGGAGSKKQGRKYPKYRHGLTLYQNAYRQIYDQGAKGYLARELWNDLDFQRQTAKRVAEEMKTMFDVELVPVIVGRTTNNRLVARSAMNTVDLEVSKNNRELAIAAEEKVDGQSKNISDYEKGRRAPRRMTTTFQQRRKFIIDYLNRFDGLVNSVLMRRALRLQEIDSDQSKQQKPVDKKTAHRLFSALEQDGILKRYQPRFASGAKLYHGSQNELLLAPHINPQDPKFPQMIAQAEKRQVDDFETLLKKTDMYATKEETQIVVPSLWGNSVGSSKPKKKRRRSDRDSDMDGFIVDDDASDLEEVPSRSRRSDKDEIAAQSAVPSASFSSVKRVREPVPNDPRERTTHYRKRRRVQSDLQLEDRKLPLACLNGFVFPRAQRARLLFEFLWSSVRNADVKEHCDFPMFYDKSNAPQFKSSAHPSINAAAAAAATADSSLKKAKKSSGGNSSSASNSGQSSPKSAQQTKSRGSRKSSRSGGTKDSKSKKGQGGPSVLERPHRSRADDFSLAFCSLKDLAMDFVQHFPFKLFLQIVGSYGDVPRVEEAALHNVRVKDLPPDVKSAISAGLASSMRMKRVQQLFEILRRLRLAAVRHYSRDSVRRVDKQAARQMESLDMPSITQILIAKSNIINGVVYRLREFAPRDAMWEEILKMFFQYREYLKTNHADQSSDAWRLEEFTRELKRNKDKVSSQYALEFPRMSRSAGIWFLPHPNQITKERLLFSEPHALPSLRLMNELGKVCNIYSTAVGTFYGRRWLPFAEDTWRALKMYATTVEEMSKPCDSLTYSASPREWVDLVQRFTVAAPDQQYTVAMMKSNRVKEEREKMFPRPRVRKKRPTDGRQSVRFALSGGGGGAGGAANDEVDDDDMADVDDASLVIESRRGGNLPVRMRWTADEGRILVKEYIKWFAKHGEPPKLEKPKWASTDVPAIKTRDLKIPPDLWTTIQQSLPNRSLVQIKLRWKLLKRDPLFAPSVEQKIREYRATGSEDVLNSDGIDLMKQRLVSFRSTDTNLQTESTHSTHSERFSRLRNLHDRFAKSPLYMLEQDLHGQPRLAVLMDILKVILGQPDKNYSSSVAEQLLQDFRHAEINFVFSIMRKNNLVVRTPNEQGALRGWVMSHFISSGLSPKFYSKKVFVEAQTVRTGISKEMVNRATEYEPLGLSEQPLQGWAYGPGGGNIAALLSLQAEGVISLLPSVPEVSTPEKWAGAKASNVNDGDNDDDGAGDDGGEDADAIATAMMKTYKNFDIASVGLIVSGNTPLYSDLKLECKFPDVDMNPGEEIESRLVNALGNSEVRGRTFDELLNDANKDARNESSSSAPSPEALTRVQLRHALTYLVNIGKVMKFTAFDESRYILRRNASFCTVKPFTVHEELRPVRPTGKRRRLADVSKDPHKRRSRFDRYRKEFKLPNPRPENSSSSEQNGQGVAQSGESSSQSSQSTSSHGAPEPARRQDSQPLASKETTTHSSSTSLAAASQQAEPPAPHASPTVASQQAKPGYDESSPAAKSKTPHAAAPATPSSSSNQSSGGSSMSTSSQPQKSKAKNKRKMKMTSVARFKASSEWVSVRPWILLDGTVNVEFTESVMRTILSIVMEVPGVSLMALYRSLRVCVVTPAQLEEVLDVLEIDGKIIRRKIFSPPREDGTFEPPEIRVFPTTRVF